MSLTLRLVETPRNAAILDRALGAVQDAIGEPWLNGILDGLVVQMREMHNGWPPARWAVFARECRSHELGELLRQDPFTRWAFEKPRGHAGDARSLDFLYHHESVEAELHAATDTGFQIAQYTTSQATLAQSMRHRRRVLAQYISNAAGIADRPHILSVECGHLREAHLSTALRDREIGRFVAVDEDEESIAVVRKDLGDCVEAVTRSVRSILDGGWAPGRFHLVYAAKAYEHLPESAARRLTEILFGLLNPGGILLIPNFLPANRDTAYMDAFLDWAPVSRSIEDIRSLSRSLPVSEVVSRRFFEDPLGNLGYLEVTRAPA